MQETYDVGDPVILSCDAWGQEILTVGALKALLAQVEDYRHVVIATPDWYSNVESVALPDDDGFACFTLFPGTELNTRQF